MDPVLRNSTIATPNAKNRTLVLEKPADTIQDFLLDLVQQSIVLAEDLQQLPQDERKALMTSKSLQQLLDKLLALKLVTPYVAERILTQKQFGLVLGNYRILERLGVGGMGVVFKAEHVRLRRTVAIKVLASTFQPDSKLLGRFYAETRMVARIQHPNIVAAIDVGDAFPTDPTAAPLHYFVMEYVPGQDLETIVTNEGAMRIARAAGIIVQIAEALAEAHRHDLIHRDIKPSNILVTDDDQAKLLDFGLARHFTHRLTEPGTVLGTIGYMAPEQARDSTQVDLRADIYSLGATLFWCVTGRDPFPSTGHATHDLAARLTQPPPSACQICPQVPTGLDLVINRMMAIAPEDRYPTALAVARALVPYLKPRSSDSINELSFDDQRVERRVIDSHQVAFARRVLIVDDDESIRDVCKRTLVSKGITCHEAKTGQEALEALQNMPFDLILLDVELPDCKGTELLQHIRARCPQRHLKIVMMSGNENTDELEQLLLHGADDFLAKPFRLMRLQARVRAALRLKTAQDSSHTLREQLQAANSELEQALSVRDVELANARQMLVQAFSQVIVQRGAENADHLRRIRMYCRVLGMCYAAAHADVPGLNETWLRSLEMAAPLHDLGMFTLPDLILHNPSKFTDEERMLLQSHTTSGSEMLLGLASRHQFASDLLKLSAEIARSHHERFDGSGYPDGLKGEGIPLSARMVGIADVYDALRSRRAYKPALSHKMAMITILDSQHKQFDPALLQILEGQHEQFELIFRGENS
ncbi:MAG TPA: HD domain-containing phosphohydrolase [Gemmataceae bacterium]|jgi:response regulator RpfG family c-di-GMP phosphodiesterase|nr:HD domain-containing phosphohydrolase [Gemmataceae bacterium]